MGKIKKLLSSVIAGCVMMTSMALGGINGSAAYQRVSVHDPSVIKLADGSYYIAGSHLVAARSTDLKNWNYTANSDKGTKNTTFFKNIYTDLAKPNSWSNTSANYDLSGNLWAPDIVYNKVMKKYCMYLSVNGDNYHSSIVMCTADNIDGPYTYVDTIVYSGFETSPANAANNYKNTDVEKVLGVNPDLSRYLKNGRWNASYGTNAIDPCVFYDEQGKLWMIYGSWFGGLYMLELDEATGLRDYNVKYETKVNVSDAYMGKKAAGGYWNSGEGPYIEYMKDPYTGKGYYYLFISYGWFNTYGGYNMRIFRSENPDGPYVDENGNSAIYKSAATDNAHNNTNGWTGMRLMANYQWSCNNEPYRAQGHNSAIMDDDGKLFVIYHTRFDNYTPGFHEVRVHQLIMNEDGWITATPYEYSGETLAKGEYSLNSIVGEYEFIYHTPTQNFTNEKSAAVDKPCKINLNADGTVSGFFTGTWKVTEGTPYLTFSYGGVDYKGAFIVQADESSSQTMKMTFTATANNSCIWGSKVAPYNAADDMVKEGVKMDTDVIYTFKNLNSLLVMDIKDGKIENDVNIQQWESNGFDCQQWILKPVSDNDNYYYICSARDDNFALKSNGSSNGGNISLAPLTKGDNSMQFKFTENLDGSYSIMTRSSNDSKLVEVANASIKQGENIQQWEPNGNNCQKWLAETSLITTVTTTTTTTTVTTTTTSETTTTEEETAETSTTTTEPIILPLKGDANGNGIVEISDIVTLHRFLVKLGDLPEPNLADMDDSSSLNVIDLLLLKRKIIS